MGSSLKDALLKLGIKQEIKVQKPPLKKTPVKKEFVPIKPAGKPVDIAFKKGRSFCDDCKKMLPDIEYYEHKAPTKAKWLCTACADKYAIPDSTRQTNLSDFSKRGIFRREYGETKKFFK